LRHPARTFALVAALAAVFLCTIGPAPSGADGVTNPKHFFWAPGQSPQGTVNAAANDLIYHGGNVGSGAIGVQTKPAVYLVYWGPEWAAGFTTYDSNGTAYSSKTLFSPNCRHPVGHDLMQAGSSPTSTRSTQSVHFAILLVPTA